MFVCLLYVLARIRPKVKIAKVLILLFVCFFVFWAGFRQKSIFYFHFHCSAFCHCLFTNNPPPGAMGRKCSRTVHSHWGGCGWQAQADRADPRLLLLPHQDQHRAAWHPTEENQDVLLLLAVSHSAHAHVPNKVKNLSFPQKLSISPQKLIVQCAGQKRDYWNISRRFPRPRLSKIFSWQRGRLVRGFHQIHKMFMIDDEIHSTFYMFTTFVKTTNTHHPGSVHTNSYWSTQGWPMHNLERCVARER